MGRKQELENICGELSELQSVAEQCHAQATGPDYEDYSFAAAVGEICDYEYNLTREERELVLIYANEYRGGRCD